MMKFICLMLLLATSFSSFAFFAEYPKTPVASLTPGSLCDHPDYFRYREKIAYCERDVSTNHKNYIIETYRKLGYRLDAARRSEFKIDHYIPLCAGGSNNSNNLWPQHHTVYKLTDPVDELACRKMESGKLTQQKAISLIKFAKEDVSNVPSVMRELQKLR